MKKSQAFLFSSIVFALFLFGLSYLIKDLINLNRIGQKEDYYISLNYFLNTIKEGYDKNQVDWIFGDCVYRIKILVVNPGIEKFLFIKIENLTFLNENTISFYLTNFNCEQIKLIDQYGRRILTQGFLGDNGKCGIKFWDFLNSNEFRYYYLYYGCSFFDDAIVNEPAERELYYYQVFNLERKDLYESMVNNIIANIISKQNYEFIHSVNFTLQQEKFNQQNDWLYHWDLILR